MFLSTPNYIDHSESNSFEYWHIVAYTMDYRIITFKILHTKHPRPSSIRSFVFPTQLDKKQTNKFV